MKLWTKCLIAMVIVVMTSFCVSATDTTTKFQTGPFSVSVDLGMPCSDINISQPVKTESLSGSTFTQYSVNCCGVLFEMENYDKDTFDITSAFDTVGILKDLLSLGADKDAISTYQREISGMPGAVGSAYVPKYAKTVYAARYYASPKSLGYIYAIGNETEMISILKTIHVTEAA